MATQGAVLWSTTAATNATVDPSVNFAEGQAPSSLNDSNRGAMASFARWRNDVSVGTVTGGTSTAYTLVTNATFASLAAMDGALLCFAVHTANGAAPTLNVDGLGAKNLVSATGVTLAAGVFSAGTVVLASYLNSASEFRIVGAPIIPDASISTAKLADDAVTYAKLQNVAAVSLIGNATAGSTNPTGITLGDGLAFSGSELTVGAVGTMQDLTSGTGATYTPTAGARWIRCRVQAGGGGGAGTGGDGGVGGTTTFNSLTAVGGSGGVGASAGGGGAGGAGGTGGTGTVSFRVDGGQGGGGGGAQGGAPGHGGMGAASNFGGGGSSRGGTVAVAGLAARANSGSGGGGASHAADAGGDGGGGAGEYFEVILAATTYTYTIGAAGAAGAAGGGVAGGAGGSGRVIVEEYYS